MKYGAPKILKGFTRVQGQLVRGAKLFLIVKLTLVCWYYKSAPFCACVCVFFLQCFVLLAGPVVIFVFIYANLLSFSPFDTIDPLPTLCQQTAANGHCLTLMIRACSSR